MQKVHPRQMKLIKPEPQTKFRVAFWKHPPKQGSDVQQVTCVTPGNTQNANLEFCYGSAPVLAAHLAGLAMLGLLRWPRSSMTPHTLNIGNYGTVVNQSPARFLASTVLCTLFSAIAKADSGKHLDLRGTVQVSQPPGS